MAPPQLVQLSAINLWSTFLALRRRPRTVLLANGSFTNVSRVTSDLKVVASQIVFLALVKLCSDP